MLSVALFGPFRWGRGQLDAERRVHLRIGYRDVAFTLLAPVEVAATHTQLLQSGDGKERKGNEYHVQSEVFNLFHLRYFLGNVNKDVFIYYTRASHGARPFNFQFSATRLNIILK